MVEWKTGCLQDRFPLDWGLRYVSTSMIVGKRSTHWEVKVLENVWKASNHVFVWQTMSSCAVRGRVCIHPQTKLLHIREPTEQIWTNIYNAFCWENLETWKLTLDFLVWYDMTWGRFKARLLRQGVGYCFLLHHFYRLNGTCTPLDIIGGCCETTFPKFNRKWYPGIGDSFWKPSFFGSMLNLGSVAVVVWWGKNPMTCFFSWTEDFKFYTSHFLQWYGFQ